MQVKNLQTQKGFTLVEIAIVLVIIGLLLGGVLKGQELIENSKIKSVTQDFDGISAAYYAYQDRTGTVPGDTGTVDGLVDDNSDFWNNLRAEGFIKGISEAGATGPTHALDGLFAVSGGGATQLFTKNHVCASNIEAGIAQGMDTKLDDGVSTSGIIRAVSGSDYTVPATPITVCREL